MSENYDTRDELVEGVDIPYSKEYLQGVEEMRKIMAQDTQDMLISKNSKSPVNTPSKILSEPIRGTIIGGIYEAPDVERLPYMTQVYHYARDTKYYYFKPLESSRIHFLESNDHLNLFHPDLIKVFNNFLLGYKYTNILVVRGLSVPNDENINPHNTGMAIDILARTTEEKNHIMNTAWSVGIPNIVQAGDDTSDIHIHLDILPKAEWTYNGFYYEGPWSLSRFT